jgi:hypothetical protein
MNKIQQIIFIFFLVTSSNCSNAQSKQECLDMLNDNLLLIENFLNADKYEPIDLQDLQATFSEQPHQTENDTKIDEGYLFPKGHPPITKYVYPNTLIEVRFDRFDISKILGDGYNFTLDFMDNIADAIYKVKKIYFLDGTIETGEDMAVEKIISEQFGNQTLVLKSTKPIKNFDYSMETSFNKEIIYEISAGQTIKTPAGSIEIVHCGDGYVRVKVPESMRHVIKIVAEDGRGRKLSKVMSGNGAAYKSEYLTPYVEGIKHTIAQLENDEITCAEASSKFSYDRIIADLHRKENSLFLTEYFVSDFKKASIVFWDKTQVERKVYLRNSADLPDGGHEAFYERCSCTVAQDKKTELFGIIGLDGNWIIAPSFLKLTAQWGNKNLFRGQPSGEKKSYEYLYDKEKKSLTKISHLL